MIACKEGRLFFCCNVHNPCLHTVEHGVCLSEGFSIQCRVGFVRRLLNPVPSVFCPKASQSEVPKSRRSRHSPAHGGRRSFGTCLGIGTTRNARSSHAVIARVSICLVTIHWRNTLGIGLRSLRINTHHVHGYLSSTRNAAILSEPTHRIKKCAD